jgi:outer membrane protein TolC
MFQRAIAAGISVPCLLAQQLAIAPGEPSGPAVIRDYQSVTVPPVRLNNSPRLADLVRAGTLYLTAQDAIALAIENNIDVEISRYNPIVANWNLVRSQAGGFLPGVPNAASQAGSVALGQGVAGSQAAAGVGIIGSGGNTGRTSNATISQIGPVAQTLDPAVQETSTFSHQSFPQPNGVQSRTPVLISDTRAHTLNYQQGFLTGGNIDVRFTDNYLKENSPTDLLNPSTAANLSLSVQQNLLRGFGIGVNARTITVSKMNVGTSDLRFKSQVIGVVSQVLNVYYALAGDYEDLKAKENAAQVADTFLQNVKRQIDVGSISPSDAILAETQSVNSRQAAVDARASLRQDELRLKNLISRTGTADPVTAGVRILPVDKIAIPGEEILPPLDEMVRQAIAARADLAANKATEAASEVNLLGTRNGVQPNLQVFAGLSNAGLSGTGHTVSTIGGVEQPDPYFVGGLGNALAQVFRRNFPTERVGALFAASVRNRQADADYAIDELTLRQTQLGDRKQLNQVQVDVLNYVVALQQARARYESATRNRALQEELFTGEQRKYTLGASTPYLVTQQQRDLITAQSAELDAAVAYQTARIGLNQTLGTTLEAANVTIAETRDGKIARESSAPAAP